MGQRMSKLNDRLGIISAALLGTWLISVALHHGERSVELFPLLALVTGLFEVARKQRLAQRFRPQGPASHLLAAEDTGAEGYRVLPSKEFSL